MMNSGVGKFLKYFHYFPMMPNGYLEDTYWVSEGGKKIVEN
jgi:hypothetical protein